MRLEDITPPRVFKFCFNMSEDRLSESLSTGIIKKFLMASIESDDPLIVSIWAEVVPSSLLSSVSCLLLRGGDAIPEGFSYVSTVYEKEILVYHIYAKATEIGLAKNKSNLSNTEPPR